jgi:hypothetical protein
VLFFLSWLSGVWHSFGTATDLMCAEEKSGRLPMWGDLKSVLEPLLCRSAVKMTHYRVTIVANCIKHCIHRNGPQYYISCIMILCDMADTYLALVP